MIEDTRYYPMFVSEDGTPETRTDFVLYREKLRSLNTLQRNILLSRTLPEHIVAIGERFHITESHIGRISALIRKICFGEISLVECDTALRQMNIPGIDEVSSTAITQYIQQNILTISPEADEDEPVSSEHTEPTSVKLLLLEALAKYPQLGQQGITESRIKLKTSTELVRGSLLNWLRYYREELGVGYHDALMRGQFLFHSQNGAKLTDEEHVRIGIILRSIEDHELVDIDTERQCIVFPPFVQTNPHSTTSTQSTSVPPVYAQSRVEPLRSTPVATAQTPISEIPSLASRGVFLESTQSVTPVVLPSISDTGTAHVVSESTHRANTGMLHFSSKHVLPAEKEMLHRQNVQSGTSEDTQPETIARSAYENLPTRSMPAPSFVKQSPIQTASASIEPIGSKNTVSPGALSPPQAPKRSPSYIPNPFRIDPMSRSDSLDT